MTAFQGYTFLQVTWLPFRDIPFLYTSLSGIYLSYIPAFQGYTFLIYQPFRDIPSLDTSHSGIYIPYIHAFQGIPSLHSSLSEICLPFRDKHFLHSCRSEICLPYLYQPFRNIPSLHSCLCRDIPSLHTCLLGLYIPFIPARALNVLYCITTFPGQCHLKSARYHSKMYEQSKPPCKRY